MTGILLFDYWRSSASYRVRIGLNLKGVDYQAVPTSLLAGEQRNEDYLARNPQGLVPMLHIDGVDISQSLAIIDYLDARFPEPRLIPADPLERATALAFAQVIAADIHPLNNLRVLKYLKRQMGQEQDAIDDWYRHWVAEGFAALEAMAPDSGFLGGDAPNVADVFLVPQMYNARRLETPLDACPRLVRIDAALNGIETIAAAAPERVKPDE